jgi:hypothetical protein
MDEVRREHSEQHSYETQNEPPLGHVLLSEESQLLLRATDGHFAG